LKPERWGLLFEARALAWAYHTASKVSKEAAERINTGLIAVLEELAENFREAHAIFEAKKEEPKTEEAS